MISINTPYFIGSITAIILNLIIPTDLIDDAEIEAEETWHLKQEGGEGDENEAKQLSSEEDENEKGVSVHSAEQEA